MGIKQSSDLKAIVQGAQEFSPADCAFEWVGGTRRDITDRRSWPVEKCIAFEKQMKCYFRIAALPVSERLAGVRANMFKELGEKYGATNFGEVYDLFEAGKVDSRKVKDWARSGIFRADFLTKAVVHGYPELRAIIDVQLSSYRPRHENPFQKALVAAGRILGTLRRG